MIIPVSRLIPDLFQRLIPGLILGPLQRLMRPLLPTSSLGLWTALVVLLPLLSCRDHLYYASSDTATVLVEPDWSASGVHPNGVTVYAYREPDGSLYKRFPPVSAQEKCYVKLPQGDFTLVVMNDTPEEFRGRIDFAGEENLGTFQALGVKDETRSKKLQDHLKAMAAAAEVSDESAAVTAETSGSGTVAKNGSTKADGELYCIVEPDTLAVSVIRGVHISPEQVDYYYERPEKDLSAESAVVVPVEMKSAVSKVNIKAHVKGLKYARGTTLSFLRGVSAGRDIALETNSSLTAAHAFILNNRKFDPGSDSDGTITASFLSFGLVGDGTGDSRYYLDVNFVLINGEDHPLTFDVTDLISVDVSLSLQLTLNLDLEIVLPEVVGEEGGGFNTDISEWEDEVVDIPI